MRLKQILDYYSREDIQQAILKVAKDREVAGVFRNGSFSNRPNTLMYPQDIISMVRQGVIEFHCSLERWKHPMALKPDNYDDLRKGWDLVLDLDCNVFEHGRAAAKVFSDALEKHGIKGYSVKFTESRGFHIGVPGETMSKDSQGLEKQYPDIARSMAAYLRDFARDSLERALLKEIGTPEKIAEQMGVPLKSLVGGSKGDELFDPYVVVDVDPVLISPRHLFRMPYSLHRGSGLASMPLKPSDIMSFERDMAKPEKIRTDTGFLDNGEEGESQALLIEAMDWKAIRKPEKEGRPKAPPARPGAAIRQEFFPPCIKNILSGLSDGKKRSLFVLTNFLSTAGWSMQEIEKLIMEWNQRNSPPLRESYIRTHMRWHQARKRAGEQNVPPPGCNKEGYYISVGVCRPDNVCGGGAKTIKNPINYAMKRSGAGKRETKFKQKRRNKK